jgi:hypothetical protein
MRPGYGLPRDKDRPKAKRGLSPSEAGRLKHLEALYGEALEALCRHPSDEELSRRVRHIEIDIVRLTGEKTLDY